MAANKSDGIVMTEDSILLTGRPATVLRAMIRGLRLEVSGESFPGKLDDWECALADFCAEIVKGGGVCDRGYPPKSATWGKSATWRGKKFKG